ncbi:MAG TPA: hypothetical protein VFJ05_03495 [Nitrososphaeraceae archaeon]|nr:hypothetical protein [Nitrososphaeraceae archaeon]
MSRRSNKSVAATLATSKDEDFEIHRKITLATEGFFTTTKFCELTLRDRNKLSKENTLTVSEYIIAMKREINPSPNTIRTTVQILAEFSKSVGISKKFNDMMTR